MTDRELADYLGVAVATIRTWASRGQIPSVRLAHRTTRYDRAEIDAWAAARRKGPEVAR
jgi:excisionase family DNA binding protein